MSYEDNLDAVLAEWDDMAPSRSHELEVQNVMEYASFIHSKTGLYLFNDEKLLEEIWKIMGKIISEGLPLNDKYIRWGLEAAGYEYIKFLQSLTGSMRPPVKLGEGMRRAHPGGWSDVTGNLVAAFLFVVDGGERKFTEGQSVSIPLK